MAPQIPDRWLDYKPVGEIINGTRFIAFKVPLREHIVQSVPSEIRLSCGSLLDKIPSLGMIIDLTNTSRYYDPTVFQKQGVVYQKLMIPGHHVPPKDCVTKFIMLVNNFLRENANNAKLIGVHCTHGVNRTGYLISRYMISEMNINPEEAIKNVEEARGHRIERENYRDNLCRRPSSGTSNGSHPDSFRRSNNNTKSQNTSHRYDNNRSQRPSYPNRRPNNSRQEYNNRPRMSSNDQTVDNWRVPKTETNNIAPLDSGPGNRYDGSTSGSRERSSIDERQYSQRRYFNDRDGPGKRYDNSISGSRQRSSIDESKYSQRRYSIDRDERHYSPRRYSIDRDERHYSPRRYSIDRDERQYSWHRSSFCRDDGQDRDDRHDRDDRRDRDDMHDRDDRHDRDDCQVRDDRRGRDDMHDRDDRHVRDDRDVRDDRPVRDDRHDRDDRNDRCDRRD